MILRPSKIFVSLHQLRNYVQSKVSGLVATTSQPSAATQLTNYPTTQRNIKLFSDILVQKRTYFQQAKKNTMNNKLLLNVIQRHLPISKVFSQPTIHHRSVVWASKHSSLQCRTITSTTTGGGTIFMNYGFPRSAVVGLGKSQSMNATRQFSTTKAPCVTLFQNTQPTNVIARIFSPAGTKLPQPAVSNEEKPKFVPFYSSEKDLSSSDGLSISCSDELSVSSVENVSFSLNKVDLIRNISTAHPNKGIVEAIVSPKEEVFVVNKPCLKTKGSKKLGLIEHDEMSRFSCKRKSNMKTKRRVRFKNLHDYPEPKIITTGVYLSIDMNSLPLNSSDWTAECLDKNLIRTIDFMIEAYHWRVSHVKNLLDRLRFSGEQFRPVSHQHELRIYFTSFTGLDTKYDVIDYLKRIQIDQDDELFKIVIEKSTEIPDFSLNDYFKEIQGFLDHTDNLIENSFSLFRN